MITIIAGGTGSVKLVRGITNYFDEVNIISNVADNFWIYDLYVTPDIDTIIYGMSGLLDNNKGWGISNDSFNFLKGLERLGQNTWFRIGDTDLALHYFRTANIRKGKRLTEIIKDICQRYSISSEILPVSDDHTETRMETNKGDLHIQEYWVRYKAELEIKRIYIKGIEDARLNPLVQRALEKSERIIIAPGNPITSIEPILKVKNFANILSSYKDKTIAISPLSGETAFSGPAIRYLKVRGIDTNPFGIAKFYSNFISSFIISEADNLYKEKINNLGIRVIEKDILFENKEKEKIFGSYIYNLFG